MGRRTLSRDRARRFYDRLGERQDSQLFYERPALEKLVEHAGFEAATAVVELGCGTGRFARELLTEYLGSEATYRGFDLSPEMIRIARTRVGDFAPRASVEGTDGTPPLALGDGACDRFVSAYVLDLLPVEEIATWLDEAGRLLRPGGLLGLVGIAPGPTPASKAVMALWALVHRIEPALVGGCRPLEVRPLLDREPERWRVLHRSRVVACGVASEVIVARRE